MDLLRCPTTIWECLVWSDSLRKVYFCHKLSIVHPSQLCCPPNFPPNFPPNLYFNNLFRPNHKSHLSYYYVLVLFVFPCLLHRRVAWNSTSRCWTFETLESISNQFRMDLRLCQINLKSISNQSRNDAKSVLIRSLIDLRSISDQSRIDLESVSDWSRIDFESISDLRDYRRARGA